MRKLPICQYTDHRLLDNLYDILARGAYVINLNEGDIDFIRFIKEKTSLKQSREGRLEDIWYISGRPGVSR